MKKKAFHERKEKSKRETKRENPRGLADGREGRKNRKVYNIIMDNKTKKKMRNVTNCFGKKPNSNE